MSVDTIGDFLTVMRNGLLVEKKSVTVQHSNFKEEIAKVLKEEDYIKDYKEEQDGSASYLTVMLKYAAGEPVIHELVRISKLGRRHYENKKNLSSVVGGLGVSILTTSRGVMSDRQAKKLGVGGEVICHVW